MATSEQRAAAKLRRQIARKKLEDAQYYDSPELKVYREILGRVLRQAGYATWASLEVMQEKQRRLSLDEIAEAAGLTTDKAYDACEELRRQGLLRGAKKWGYTIVVPLPKSGVPGGVPYSEAAALFCEREIFRQRSLELEHENTRLAREVQLLRLRCENPEQIPEWSTGGPRSSP